MLKIAQITPFVAFALSALAVAALADDCPPPPSPLPVATSLPMGGNLLPRRSLLPMVRRNIPGEIQPEVRTRYYYSENERQIRLLYAERKADPQRDHWVAVIPGESEQWGHHKAPPTERGPDGLPLISDAYKSRLDTAYQMLVAGKVRFLMISGGAIDDAHPEYVEGRRGREYLLAKYGARWHATPSLADRLMVESKAGRSTTNIHNTNRMCAELGVTKNYVVTDMPSTPDSMPAEGITTQGFYFYHQTMSTFSHRCVTETGHEPGNFEWKSLLVDGGRKQIEVLEHPIPYEYHNPFPMPELAMK